MSIKFNILLHLNYFQPNFVELIKLSDHDYETTEDIKQNNQEGKYIP